MRYLLVFSVLMVAAAAPSTSGSAEQEIIKHHFATSGNRYTFTGSFTIEAEEKCLLNMLYEPEQLRQYARHADSVELAEEGDGWQIIIYDYSRVLYRSRSTFKRMLNTSASRIDYHLTAIEQHGLVSPDIRFISGYYMIAAENSQSRVIFHQEGVIGDTVLSGLYFYNAEKEAIGFVTNMQQYAMNHCR